MESSFFKSPHLHHSDKRSYIKNAANQVITSVDGKYAAVT